MMSLLVIPILWGAMRAAASVAAIDQNACDWLCDMTPGERGAAAANLYLGSAILLLPAFLIPALFTPLVAARQSPGVGWFIRRLSLQWAVLGAMLGFSVALLTNTLYSIMLDSVGTLNWEIKNAFGDLALSVAAVAFAIVGAAIGAALAWCSLLTAPRQGNAPG